MPGVEQQIGIGNAQVIPDRSQSLTESVERATRQRDRFRERQVEDWRDTNAQKEKDERDQYGIIGSTLNPRTFNDAIHYKVLQAQKDLAQAIKMGKSSYADTYLLAQNKAAELGGLSDSLNRLDQQLSLTKKEYEQSDKRINSAAVELAARKRILDQIAKGGKIDENVNYFDDVLNKNPEIGLIDNSDYTFTDFKPEEKQPLKFSVNKRNAVGRTNKYTWDMDNYPAYYDVKQKGEFESPEITTKGVPSGLKDANKQDVPMLSEDAYKRFSLTPSNVVAINRRIKREIPNINLNSKEAEILRRVEAYEDVEKNKPRPRESMVEQAPVVHVSTSGANAPAAPIDLREQEDTPYGKNIMSLLQGIKVTGLPDGKTLLAENAEYDPANKRVKYKEYVSQDDEGKYGKGKEREVSLVKFKQDIKTNNPGIDMKFLDGLDKAITGKKPEAKTAETKKMVTMTLPDGRSGEIPEDKVADFLKDNPKAKRK